MKIYACDSTAKTASVTLCEDEILLAQYTQNNGNTHSETLLPMTETMLRAMNTDTDEIDIFACSAGPGSFTGVRIGAATVKGLAFGKGKVCIGVSTLDALARNLLDDIDKIICPVMDARRGQLYTATFRSHSGKLERITPDRAISYPEFEQDVIALGEKVWLCGDGYSLVKRLLPEGTSHDTPEMLRYQSAYSVARSALDEYRNGIRTTDADLRPVYLRLSQAERERLASEGKTTEN
ncbi:MAG: tRNA (adenosine(37)-N6)-threonylcarbamoyltransferase complex dimerization subunit type 1 TsaB [Clostridia bacterium]|nr:tRNA (adenosine(37)-N6)-threonylcarbamoyltransferase complex dimerization subunit type 1 TsaB [Clostridia bacterium]